MPCLDITTNLNLDGVDLDPVFSRLTTTIAAIVDKPQAMIMVVVKGSVGICFGGNKEAAALGEIISIQPIDRVTKRNLIAQIGLILENMLSIPRTRFVLKVYTSPPSTTAAATSKL